MAWSGLTLGSDSSWCRRQGQKMLSCVPSPGFCALAPPSLDRDRRSGHPAHSVIVMKPASSPCRVLSKWGFLLLQEAGRPPAPSWPLYGAIIPMASGLKTVVMSACRSPPCCTAFPWNRLWLAPTKLLPGTQLTPEPLPALTGCCWTGLQGSLSE